MAETGDPPVVSILLLGDTVGKSTFFARLSQGFIDAKKDVPLKHLHDLDQPFIYDISRPRRARRGQDSNRSPSSTCRLQFSDTASAENYTLLSPDIVILCYDVSDRRTLERVRNHWSKQAHIYFLRRYDIPVFLLGFKRDLRDLPWLNIRASTIQVSQSSAITPSSLRPVSLDSPPPYSATSRPSASLYHHEADDDVNPLLDLNVSISPINVNSNSITTTSSSSGQERSKEIATREEEEEEEENIIVHPHQGYRLAQDLRCDRYLECSSLTNHLVPEVFQDIASSAVDIVRSRDPSLFSSGHGGFGPEQCRLQ